MKIKSHKHKDKRTIRKFLWLPKYHRDGYILWLEYVELNQVYLNGKDGRGWYTYTE